MNITIDREVLLENLNIIQRGLPVKTPNPILTNIKFEVTDNDIYMTTSNSDISVEVVISHDSLVVESTGVVLIPGRFFIDIIRKVTSSKVNLYLVEEKILVVKVDRGEYKLHVSDPLDYPKVEFVALENPLNFSSNLLKEIIKETVFACSQSEKKPIITGVNFKLSNNVLTVTSTDSYRLAKKVINIESYQDFDITIPSKSLDEILKILEQYNDNISLYFETKKLLVKFKNTLFQTRLLDGNYPSTDRIIPTSFTTKLSFNKDELINAVERVSLLSPREKEKDRELSYSIIKFDILPEMIIEISTFNSSVGDAKEELIPTNIETPSVISIGCSSKYLVEALRSFNSTEITMNIVGTMRPFIITGEQDKDIIQLILPVKLD